MSDRWVTLIEHRLQVGWVPIDTAGAELLFLESVLIDQGVQVVFDPFRPGEGGGFTDTVGQPLRLLVKESDLVRAREVVAAVSESMPPGDSG